LASAEIRRINRLLGKALLSFEIEDCDELDDPTEEQELNDLLLEAECNTLESAHSSGAEDSDGECDKENGGKDDNEISDEESDGEMFIMESDSE
jgi:hypothetical protein